MASCNICTKRAQNHSFHMECSFCQGKVHLKRHPMVDKKDSIYSHRDSDVWFCTAYTKDIFPFIEEDHEVLETLTELHQLDSLIPFDILTDQNKIFSPFELNEDSNLPLINSDPDGCVMKGSQLFIWPKLADPTFVFIWEMRLETQLCGICSGRDNKDSPRHYSDVIMSPMASQITDFKKVYSAVCSGPDQRKHQSSASLAFVRGIHWWPVNSPHKGPVTRKMFPFDDVIMENVYWW